MRYWVYPFEVWQEFGIKTKKGKKKKWGRKEFGMTSAHLRHALLGATL